MNKIFTDRIKFQGNLNDILLPVCEAYKIGSYSAHQIVEIGYEDLNIILTTSLGKYLVKIFGSFRDSDNIDRYVDIMQKVVDNGISHPKLYSSQGKYLYKYNKEVSLCVIEYVNGKSFYDLNIWPTKKDAKILIDEVTKINSLPIKPKDVYDEWSPVNLVKEFGLKQQCLDNKERELIQSLVRSFSRLKINKLPHSFVHGDIIRPNVLKDNNSKMYIIDYSCASVKPRVQELGILLCGMFFNENNPGRFQEFYNLVVKDYKPRLTETELSALPLFVRAGFAIYVLQGTYTKKVKGISHKENDHWINLGQIGLKYTDRIFN